MEHSLLEDGEHEGRSGTAFLVIHIIIKALEDLYSPEESDEADFYRESAQSFFSGCPEESNYSLYLSFLGWDVEQMGLISPEAWFETIETSYNSVVDAKPKMGMSTRLIPRDTELWRRIRQNRGGKSRKKAL